MSKQTKSPRRILTWADWESALKNNSSTEAERRLVEACLEGRQCKLGDGSRPKSRTPKNEIGSDLLRYLIKGGCDACDLHDWGVDLVGAYITGKLDLRLVTATGVTGMINCHFEATINAMNAQLYLLSLRGSSCPSLDANGTDVKGDFFLDNGFVAYGAVSLAGAVIGGQLVCSGGSFENAEGDALNAQGVKVKDGVFLCDGFAAKGEVSLAGAVIGGDLACIGGSFENSDGVALNAQGIDVKGDVFLRDRFAAKGEVSFAGAVIGGQLACVGGSFENADGDALSAHSVEVKGGVFLCNGFAAKGEVSLAGALIGGTLACSGGSFENAEGHALNAQGVEVKGGVFLHDGFAAKGEVGLSGAVIGGQLICSGGSFENAEGDALSTQGVEVKGGVSLDSGFAAKGEVSLSSAVIGGPLICSGGSFENAEGVALNLQNADMNALIWRRVKKFVGSMNLAGVNTQNLVDAADSWAMVDQAYLDGMRYQTIHGPLDTKMRLEWLETTRAYDDSFSPQPYEQLAWTLKRMGHSEQRRVILVEKEKRQRRYERDSLRFRRRLARLVSRLSGKRDGSNMEVVKSHLKEMGAANKEFSNRLAERYSLFHLSWPRWAQNEGVPSSEIERAQAGFREEIFWQNGRIRVRIAWMHIKDRLARHLVGYGYRPFSFVWALALLICIGWGVAHRAYQQGDFAPNSDVILSTPDWQNLAEGDSKNPAEEWGAETGKGRDYETFSSFAYAVDVVIPIVSIGQEAAWAPSTNRGPWGKVLWWLRWLLTITGWIVTAVGAAAITGIIRRE